MTCNMLKWIKETKFCCLVKGQMVDYNQWALPGNPRLWWCQACAQDLPTWSGRLPGSQTFTVGTCKSVPSIQERVQLNPMW